MTLCTQLHFLLTLILREQGGQEGLHLFRIRVQVRWSMGLLLESVLVWVPGLGPPLVPLLGLLREWRLALVLLQVLWLGLRVVPVVQLENRLLLLVQMQGLLGLGST